MSLLHDYTYAQEGIRKALNRWAWRAGIEINESNRSEAIEIIIKELVSDFPKLLLSDDDVTVKLEASQY